MPDQHTVQPAKQITLEAVVIRADGTREDLGTIARWHRNPLIRTIDRLRRIGRITTPRS